MQIELISFRVCPFAQRAVITLNHKGVDYTATYIDLSDPPQWFSKISPFGKVPVLRVDKDTIVFESAVIAEFIDESSPGTLLPVDPLRRAVTRSWIEFGSACIGDFSGMLHARDASAYASAENALRRKLDALERTLGDGAFFNGAEPGLIDFTYAPLFVRTELTGTASSLYPASDYPKIFQWSKTLNAVPAVVASRGGDFDEQFRQFVRRKSVYAASKFGF